jgi:hypothetical protein
MTNIATLVEQLALSRGDHHVPLAELRRATAMPEDAFRNAVLALAREGRVSLHAEPRIVDSDQIDKCWYSRSAGEVRYVAVARRDGCGSGLDLLGAEHLRFNRAHCSRPLWSLVCHVLGPAGTRARQ